MCTVDRTQLRPIETQPARRIAAGRARAIVSIVMVVAAAAALVQATSSAQPRGNASQTADDGATVLDELTARVAALERLVASLDTRFSTLQAAPRPAPEPGRAAAQRIDDLERQVGQLRFDLQRMQTSIDSALRTAENAQRSATRAENTARDALSRSSR